MDSRQLKIVLELQDQASRELRKVAGQIEGNTKSTISWDGALKNVKRGILAIGGAAVAGLGFGVKVAADLQTAEIGLTTLLGSAEEARQTMERVKDEAKRTPFELPGLARATQLLSSVTKDGDLAVDVLLDVGEGLAAMGKGQAELDRIIVNLQQVAAVGKAATIDIKQFAFAGLPIYEMLAETTGLAGEALGDFIEDGGVTFDLLTTMFDEANDAGGRFFGAFENQSGSFNQALSNLKDSLGIFFADVAQSTGLFDGLTNAMVMASDALGNYDTILANLKTNITDFFSLLDEKTLLITHLRGAWISVVETFKEQLGPALEELRIALEPLMPFLKDLAVVFGAMLVAALHAVIAVLAILAKTIAFVLTALTNLVTFIVDTVVAALAMLRGWVDAIVAVFQGDWNGAIEAVRGNIETLIDWVGDLIDMFKRAIDLAKEIGGGAIDFITSVIPGRESGGPVTGGSPYIVGEAGPELFVPRNSGTIIPNGALAGMGGGMQVNVYGDVSGEELVSKVEESLARSIKGQVRV